jgi:hypothetical protein
MTREQETMAAPGLTHRLARRENLPALAVLMDAAIAELQKGFLDDAQIASSRAIMGLDTQLVDDGTYFVVEQDGVIAGCGGWSRCATMYGGDRSPGRDAALLDPAKDAARDVHASGLCAPWRRAPDPVALRRGRARKASPASSSSAPCPVSPSPAPAATSR